MNHFIVLLTYRVDLEHIDQFRDAHIAFLKGCYKRGTFLMSGPKIPREGGIIIAQSSSKEDLLKMLQEDPFYRENLASYDIIQFEKTMSAGDF